MFGEGFPFDIAIMLFTLGIILGFSRVKKESKKKSKTN